MRGTRQRRVATKGWEMESELLIIEWSGCVEGCSTVFLPERKPLFTVVEGGIRGDLDSSIGRGNESRENCPPQPWGVFFKGRFKRRLPLCSSCGINRATPCSSSSSMCFDVANRRVGKEVIRTNLRIKISLSLFSF